MVRNRPPFIIAGMRREGRRYMYDVAKYCIRCHRIRDVAEFYVVPTKKNTRAPYCKQCNSDQHKQWTRDRTHEREWNAFHDAQIRIRDRLPVMFDQLPYATRRVLMNRLFRARHTFAEITRMLGVSISTVVRHRERYDDAREHELAIRRHLRC